MGNTQIIALKTKVATKERDWQKGVGQTNINQVLLD